MSLTINRETSRFPNEKDHEAFLRDACDMMYDSIMRNFSAGGRPSPWTPKKDGTQSRLIESGRLVSSIRGEVDWSQGRASVYVPRGSVPYAFAHQFGYPPNNLPQREYMLWQPEDRIKILQMYKGFIINFLATKKRTTNAAS